VSEFSDIVDGDSEIQRKRSRIERFIFYSVLFFAILGISVAIASPSILQSVVYWFSPAGFDDPVIVYFDTGSGNIFGFNSTDEHPTFNNSYVRFNVSFSDSDSHEWHTMVVCNGTGGNYTYSIDNGVPVFTCGSRYEYCRYSSVFVTDNPLFCDFYVAGLGNQTQNFSIYVIDSGERLVNASGTFVVNRPPYITSTEVDIV